MTSGWFFRKSKLWCKHLNRSLNDIMSWNKTENMTSCAHSDSHSPASPPLTTIIQRWITLQIGCYVRSSSRIQWRPVAAPRKRLHRSIQVPKPDQSVHPDCYLQHHPALLQRRPVQWSCFHPAASGCSSRCCSGGSLEPVGLLKKRGYHTFIWIL